MPENAEDNNRKHRHLSWKGGVLLFLGGIVIFVCLLFAWGSFLVFSPKGNWNAETLSAEDLRFQGKLAADILRDMLRSERGETEKLDFSPEEVNSLFRSATNGISLRSMILCRQDRKRQVEKFFFRGSCGKNGSWVIRFEYDTEYRFLWGGVIRIEAELLPEKRDGVWKLHLACCKIGRMTIPEEDLPEVSAQLLEMLRKQPDFQTFDRVIVRAGRVENQQYEIEYLPRELRNAVLQKF